MVESSGARSKPATVNLEVLDSMVTHYLVEEDLVDDNGERGREQVESEVLRPLPMPLFSTALWLFSPACCCSQLFHTHSSVLLT